MTDMPRITLLPLGTPDRRALDWLAQDLKGMGVDVEVVAGRPLPREALDPIRDQFHADALLALARSATGERVLAVTDVDVYVGDLNFVFGIAQSPGRACVISLFRLRLDADEQRFRSRALKEAMHELGHTFGLGHCPQPDCVMRFSNSLADTDRKGAAFCRHCEEKLHSHSPPTPSRGLRR